jgi:hypothetical protein
MRQRQRREKKIVAPPPPAPPARAPARRRRQFKLDLMRGFDPSKPILSPIRPPWRPRPMTPAERDALHDYDEAGSVSKLGMPVSVDWDYLFARLDFTKNKWWLIERDIDEFGQPRIRVQEIRDGIVDDVLADFVDLSEDVIEARLERLWLKRMFRDRDENTYRFGKHPRIDDDYEPPEPAAQLDLGF